LNPPGFPLRRSVTTFLSPSSTRAFKGDRINLHVHLHFLVTEGGADEEGVFHKIPRIDDSRLAEIFAREVLSMLVRKELLEFIARVTSHIPDKGQVMVRYYGLYANAHRGLGS
jgi:hypothetical protein